LECFAEKFAAYFLIPSAALQERLHSRGVKRVRHPAEVVHLAHYFGVSYEEMLIRLNWEHQLAGSQEDFKSPLIKLGGLNRSYTDKTRLRGL
jgi:Zn-dependent peptidase ImmA (M78 family)